MTNHLKMQLLQTTSMYYLTVAGGRGLRRGLAGGFWLVVTPEAEALTWPLELQSSDGLTGAGGPSGCAAPAHRGPWLLAAQTAPKSLGCPRNKQSRRAPRGRICSVFYDLAAETTRSFLQYPTQCAGQPCSAREGTKCGGWGSLGTVLEAGCCMVLVYNGA